MKNNDEVSDQTCAECHENKFCLLQKNTISLTQPTFFYLWRFGLYQRPSSEEVWSIFPVFATIVMRRGKKSVVRVAQCVAALVLVQGPSCFLSKMYCLFDPSSTFVRFSVQNSGGRPTGHMVVMRCMVSHCWFVLLRQTWSTLVSCKRFASYGFHLCLVFLQSSTKFPSSLSYLTFLTACTWNFVYCLYKIPVAVSDLPVWGHAW